jgi:hypothetical protein
MPIETGKETEPVLAWQIPPSTSARSRYLDASSLSAELLGGLTDGHLKSSAGELVGSGKPSHATAENDDPVDHDVAVPVGPATPASPNGSPISARRKA